MKRRYALGVIAAIGAGAATWPGAAIAQAVAQRKLIAYLDANPQGVGPYAKVLPGEFARLGWRDGENIRFEIRFADHKSERIVALARELVAMNPALLLGSNTEVILALRKATDRVPIVAIIFSNPVEHGLAASLARPGGNVTGLVTMGATYRPKLIEYARIVSPKARRIGFLLNPANPNNNSQHFKTNLSKLGETRGFEVDFYPVRDVQEIQKAIASMTPASDHVLLHTQDSLFLQHLARIAELALAAKLASVSSTATWSEVGGLLTYGPDLRDYMKRAVEISDQILRGAKPADMPIEQPTRIPLILNQRTARAIGLRLPESLLVRADQIIE